MTLEETLDGKFNGLFGEIVTEDTYRIKEIEFTPTLVVDVGSNVGVFTRYIRFLFPESVIVSVEPDEENFKWLQYFTYPDSKIFFFNKAIGIGQIYHGLTAANGSGETYLSIGKSYPHEIMEQESNSRHGIEKSYVESIMPDQILNTFVEDDSKVLVKIDIEGAEHVIWTHEPSMEALRKVDYLCMEIHEYALNGELLEEEKRVTEKALKSFEDTHICVRDGVHFFATKKS